ncbi:MAG: CocE/NonD family hydrolase, partial [bacterium]
MRLSFLFLLAAYALLGQGKEFILENYTKYEQRVPMRDGKRLFTSIYVPKDASEKWPILLNRTPYSVAPYGPDQY